MLVAVPREEDVKFTYMCEARSFPVLRIGVTDGDVLDVQGQFAVPVSEVAAARAEALPQRFGALVRDSGELDE